MSAVTSLIIGGSAGLGRALAVELAHAGHDLFLVASDARDLDPLCRHLHLSYGVKTAYAAADLVNADVDALREAFWAHYQSLTNLFIVAGWSVACDRGPIAHEDLSGLINVNFKTPAAIVNAFLDDLLKTKSSNIVGIGSVAATRARGSNSVYGASKRALEFYFEAQRHFAVGTDCNIQFYRAGYIDTQMLAGRPTLLPIATPADIAKTVVGRLGRGGAVRYAPGWWRYVMSLYAILPWFLFKKLRV